MSNRNASSTKTGPGRKHGQGIKRTKPPAPAGDWAGPHTNSQRNALRRARRQARQALVSASQTLTPVEVRQRKQHVHELRDAHGAYTLVGNNPFDIPRRKWVAGLSALQERA